MPSFPSVLSDAHSRAIYDLFGKKGLEVEGWEVRILSNINFFLVLDLRVFFCYIIHTLH